MARRPRLWALVLIVFGFLYAGSALLRAQDGLDRDETLFVIGGALFAVGGIYHWFRGRSVDLS